MGPRDQSVKRVACGSLHIGVSVIVVNTTKRRPYRMGARAQATAATRERILDAALASFYADPSGSWTLDDIALGAGVSVQTVIRHVGSRDGLLGATAERENRRVAQERDPAAITDLAGAVAQLVGHYERVGDGVLRMLAEEHRSPTLRALATEGRTFHRSWCTAVFAGALAAQDAGSRPRRLAQLTALCDVYTWKLLRRDAGLSRADTATALRELLTPLVEIQA